MENTRVNAYTYIVYMEIMSLRFQDSRSQTVCYLILSLLEILALQLNVCHDHEGYTRLLAGVKRRHKTGKGRQYSGPMSSPVCR